jgi:hypothetical protein
MKQIAKNWKSWGYNLLIVCWGLAGFMFFIALTAMMLRLTYEMIWGSLA